MQYISSQLQHESFYCSVSYAEQFLQYLAQRVYWENMQHKSYWFAHLTYIMLLHYLGKNYFLLFQHLKRCFLRQYVGGSGRAVFWCWDEDADSEM